VESGGDDKQSWVSSRGGGWGIVIDHSNYKKYLNGCIILKFLQAGPEID
jgi:hypothetical protein